MEKKFAKHLIDIGFLDQKTLSQIITSYNARNDSNIIDNQFSKRMTEILFLFFDNLTNIQKKFICFHIPAKFIKLTKLKIRFYLKNIIKKKELRNKIILMKYMFKWFRAKDNINEPSLNDHLMNKKLFRQQSHKSIQANKLKKKINCEKNNNIYNSIREFIDKTKNLNVSNINEKNCPLYNKQNLNNNINNKTKSKKEKNKYNKIDLDIFNINLNDENINNLNNGQIRNGQHDKQPKMFINNNQITELIQNYTLTNQKMKDIRLIKNYDFINSAESNDNYISTNLNSCNRNENNREITQASKAVNFKTNDYNSNNSDLNMFNIPNSSKSSNAKKIINLKPKNIYNLIYCNNYNNLNNNYIENTNNIDLNLFTEKTPFCEREIKTLESNRKTNYSPGKRLYEQGIKQMQNKNNSKNSPYRLSPNSKKKNKIVNYKHINSLHKNKKRCKTLEKVKNKVEKEEGLTFRPMIHKNKYIDRINSNFLERNYSSPKNGKNMSEYNEKMSSQNISKNKKINKKEKENIINGMINRLYKNKNNLENEDDSFLCKKYHVKGIGASNYLKGYKKKI